MKKLFILQIVILFFFNSFSQPINGFLVKDTANIKIVKIWGTHYERGYAYGYLVGSEMTDLFKNYIKPMFGSNYQYARLWIEQSPSVFIENEYKTEAMALIDGMNLAGTNSENLDYIDVLVCNSFLDFFGFFKKSLPDTLGCSSFMSWGSATAGTDIDSLSVISRHVDWTQNQSIIKNQVVVIHIPAEQDEQPWIMIGFCGQIAALSGINNSGLSAFMHSLSDVNANANQSYTYEPVWFSLRKALEQKDYNNDGTSNVLDIKSVLIENQYGYAMSSIISSLCSAQNSEDSLIALVAEITCEQPYFSFRTNSYSDSIPGDNLYTANFSIARNNAHNYCTRYYNMINHIGDGTLIDDDQNWFLMQNYSLGSVSNMQFMQFIPDLRILKLSVTSPDSFAYQKNPIIFNIDSLFEAQNLILKEDFSELKIIQNSLNESLLINFGEIQGNTKIEIYNSLGQLILLENFKNTKTIELKTGGWQKGIYIIKAISKNKILTGKFVK